MGHGKSRYQRTRHRVSESQRGDREADTPRRRETNRGRQAAEPSTRTGPPRASETGPIPTTMTQPLHAPAGSGTQGRPGTQRPPHPRGYYGVSTTPLRPWAPQWRGAALSKAPATPLTKTLTKLALQAGAPHGSLCARKKEKKIQKNT